MLWMKYGKNENEDEVKFEDQYVEDMNDKDEMWVRMRMKMRLSLKISIWRMRMMMMRWG